jgi:TATA-box binding protein (TBP) (component of TFIID and TFIIIB)
MAAKITNIVATACLNCKLSLPDIESKLPMAQYMPGRFSGLLVRVLKPYKAHCQLYSNGKITVNGAKCQASALALVHRFADALIHVGYDCNVSDFKIVNVVGSFDFGRFLRLEDISILLAADYCPEIFPGLRVKLKNCSAVLFHSGKCNFLGGKCEQDIIDGKSELQERIKS